MTMQTDEELYEIGRKLQMVREMTIKLINSIEDVGHRSYVASEFIREVLAELETDYLMRRGIALEVIAWMIHEFLFIREQEKKQQESSYRV